MSTWGKYNPQPSIPLQQQTHQVANLCIVKFFCPYCSGHFWNPHNYVTWRKIKAKAFLHLITASFTLCPVFHFVQCLLHLVFLKKQPWSLHQLLSLSILLLDFCSLSPLIMPFQAEGFWTWENLAPSVILLCTFSSLAWLFLNWEESELHPVFNVLA